MDGPTQPDVGLPDEYEVLLDFLYLCPHGLAEFGADGVVRMINPACASTLLPLRSLDSEIDSGLDNLLNILAPYAPDLRTRLFTSAVERGLVLDGFRIHVGAASGAQSGYSRRMRGGTSDPMVLALSVLRLSPDRFMAVISDVSAQVAQERRLREAESWFAAVVDGADGYAFFGIDAQGRIIEWNVAAERMFSLGADEALGRHADGLLTAGTDIALTERLSKARRDGWHLAEGWLPRGSEARFWGSSIVSVMRAEEDAASPPEPEAYLVVARDTTDRREAAADLRRALCQDHLTGVTNRRHFFELAATEVSGALSANKAMSVLMVDADRFKVINDRFGHAAGDAVLCALAETLRAGTRDGIDCVGRLGGEEFGVLLPGLGLEAAADVAERLRDAVAALSVPVRDLDGNAIQIRFTASFGAAELHPASSNFEGLLRTADEALYAAKLGGRNRVHLSPRHKLLEHGTMLA